MRFVRCAGLATVVAAFAACAPDAVQDAPPEARPTATITEPVAAPETAALGPKVFPLRAAPMLDGPGRDEWQRPDEVVAALGLRPGDHVADVGCGTGYFTLRFLDALGADGHVLAVDIQQGMLDLLAKRLSEDDRERVTLRCSAPLAPLRAGDALDVVFCANTLKEVPDADQPAFVQALADGLAPGGRLVILDWLPLSMQRSPLRLGPPPEHRIAPERTRELAEGAGLVQAQEIDLLPTHAFQVFKRPR